MSLQSRLSALITAVGADIKLIKAITKVTDFSPERTVEVISKALTAGGTGWVDIYGQDNKPAYFKKTGISIYRTTPDGGYQGQVLAYSDQETTEGIGRHERIIIDSLGYSDFAEVIQPVSILPTTNLYHGKTVCFQNQSMMNNGVAWILRYRMYNVNGTPNTNADKWECVGGGMFIARDPAAVSLAANTLNYAGPEHSIPLPGWYEQVVGWNAYNGTGVSSGIVQSQMFNGSNVLWDASGEDVIQGFMNTTGFGRVNGSRYGLFPIRLTAGSVFRLGFNADHNGSVVRFRHLGIKPIRVSAA